MLISTNYESETIAFESLLKQMINTLRLHAKDLPKLISTLHGSKLEKYAYDILCDLSIQTPFEGSIELVPGQLFPDIIAQKYFGVEVKTSKSGTWKSIGSSVAEGTRIEGIERIYMLFGHMSAPIDFRCRLYQECLSGVAVTHSPRYTIDMDLPQGETFFDKLQVPYDVLRKQNAPLTVVIDYFRRNLKAGETTWWLSSNDNSKSTNPIVRLWSNLDKQEAEKIRLKGFCLFPELLSNRQDKFHRMLLWLSTEEGIIVGNLRDQYTAGGKVLYTFNEQTYELPQVLYRLIKAIDSIPSQIFGLDIEILQEYWLCEDVHDRLKTWSYLVGEQASTISNFPLELYIRTKLNASLPAS